MFDPTSRYYNLPTATLTVIATRRYTRSRSATCNGALFRRQTAKRPRWSTPSRKGNGSTTSPPATWTIPPSSGACAMPTSCCGPRNLNGSGG